MSLLSWSDMVGQGSESMLALPEVCFLSERRRFALCYPTVCVIDKVQYWSISQGVRVIIHAAR